MHTHTEYYRLQLHVITDKWPVFVVAGYAAHIFMNKSTLPRKRKLYLDVCSSSTLAPLSTREEDVAKRSNCTYPWHGISGRS